MDPNQQPPQQAYYQQQPTQAYTPPIQPHPQVAHKPSPFPKIALTILKILLVGAVAIVGGTFLETLGQDYFVFEPQSLLAIWVISFLISTVLRINNSSLLYVVIMIAATILVAFYPFSQAFIITFLLLLLGKLVRLL